MPSTLTRATLTKLVSSRTGVVNADAHAILTATFDVMHEHLVSGGTIELRDFGIFYIRERAARMAHNPKKPEEGAIYEVPRHQSVGFRVAKKLKLAVVKLPVA